MDILSISIENFRSIPDSSIEFGDFNVLVGKNNAGKSNLMKSVYKYRDLMVGETSPRELYDAAATRGKEPEPLSLEIEFEIPEERRQEIIEATSDNYELSGDDFDSLQTTNSFKNFRHKISIQENGVSHNSIRASIDGSMKELATYDSSTNDAEQLDLDDPLSSEKTRKSLSSDRVSYVLPSEVRSTLVTCLDSWNLVAPFRNPEERGEFGANPSLASTGENLTTYLQSIREDGTERYPDICGTYIDIMEGVTDLRIVTERDQHGDAAPFIRIDEENSEGIGLEALSSGAKEILILISQIVDSRMDNGPLYIEEPELHLHPAAEREIYSIIKETVEDHGSQVFVTTHSDIIVDEVDIGDVYFVNRDVYTSIDTVEEGELGRVLTNIGYSKSELLQAERVVFVEGRSDRVVLLNWAKVLNNSFSENGVHVKKFDGDEIYEDDNPYANEIPDLLGQLGIPYKFIFDSDEKQPEDKEEHIITNIGISPSKIHVLNRYCIESYLADSPGSIADVLSVSIEMVEGELPENPSETNMKSWFNDMFKSELSTGYSQEKHGALLAKNMEGHEIDAEMHELIDEITEMEGRR